MSAQIGIITLECLQRDSFLRLVVTLKKNSDQNKWVQEIRSCHEPLINKKKSFQKGNALVKQMLSDLIFFIKEDVFLQQMLDFGNVFSLKNPGRCIEF